VQAFMGEPNDLVVNTASALEIDKLSRTLTPDQQFRTTVDHGSYFQNAGVADFIAKQLGIVTRYAWCELAKHDKSERCL